MTREDIIKEGIIYLKRTLGNEVGIQPFPNENRRERYKVMKGQLIISAGHSHFDAITKAVDRVLQLKLVG